MFDTALRNSQEIFYVISVIAWAIITPFYSRILNTVSNLVKNSSTSTFDHFINGRKRFTQALLVHCSIRYLNLLFTNGESVCGNHK